MRNLLLAAAAVLSLTACDRFGDHPEQFIRVHTGVLDKISVYERDGYLSAEGVWTIDGPDKIAAPINLSTITCHRDDAYCEVRRSEIMTLSGATSLMTRYDIYTVTAWDDTQVRALLEGECRNNELRIDIPGNSVVEVTENKPGGSCDGVTSFAVERPRIARLISGQELEDMKKSGL